MIVKGRGRGMQDDVSPQQEEAAKNQAMTWVMRLTSGEATEEDAAALRRWCAESDLHRRAFAEAKLLWKTLAPATKEIAERKEVASSATPRTSRTMGRRAFLAGSLAASAAAAAYFGSRPPFLLWPSMGEILADYRTGTGQQRRLAVTKNVSMVLNTQTSVNLGKRSSGSGDMELIAGEAAINAETDTPFSVTAAGGRVSASAAHFDIRCEGSNVCVVSLAGIVNVTRHDQSVAVPAGHQTTYGDNGLGPVLPVDTAAATAWQRGILVFRHETLAHVIAEVNRYRPGRIIVIDQHLAERDVVASFHLDRINEVVEHVIQVFGARATYLPGGVVLLS